MDEMKKLIIDGQEFEVVDAAGRQRITVLENTAPSGGGLSITEKNLILQLFNKAAYLDDPNDALTALSNLWSGSYHSVSWEGTGYTKSNNDTVIEDGESFTSTVTANNGKTIESVTVTMGGETVQGAYSGGTVTIPNVTGNIVITVTTAQMTVSSISAVYTQSGTVYDTDSLDSLKADLVVTATFPDSSTAIIPAEDYTLSGTLLKGTSTITVSYGGKTASFNVTVSVPNTTAQIAIEGYVSEHTGSGTSASNYKQTAKTYGGITKKYQMDAPSTSLSLAGIIPYTDATITKGVGCIIIYNSNDTIVNHVDERSATSDNRWAQLATGTLTEYSQTWNVNSFTQITFSLDTRYLDDAYMYDATTGQVWFAGVNTPYYGMSNISEANS